MKGFIVLSKILATSNSNFNPVIQSFGNVIAIEFHELMWLLIKVRGARGGVVVKALRYKPTGRGFDSRWCHWNFSVT
jgi:hypothetical protein